MSKDAFYFSHDSNAKDDPKIMLMMSQLGLEGYGFYWVLIEILREQSGYRYPLKLLPVLAHRYGITEAKAITLVRDYGLFEIEDDYFFSKSLINRMQKMESIREKRKKAGRISAQRRKAIGTSVEQVLNMSQTLDEQKKEKEIKENKRKGNKRSGIPPTLDEVKEYCQQRGNNIDAQKWYDYYTANGWRVGKNPMKDWKAAIRTWERNEFSSQPEIKSIQQEVKEMMKQITI